MRKIIAIGDIHGELDKLHNLFERLSYGPEDTIVFLGDYIDRGPNSKGVIDFIIKLKAKCNVITLMGNHEDMAMISYEKMQGSNPYDTGHESMRDVDVQWRPTHLGLLPPPWVLCPQVSPADVRDTRAPGVL